MLIKNIYYFTIYKIGYYICINNRTLLRDNKPTGYKDLFLIQGAVILSKTFQI